MWRFETKLALLVWYYLTWTNFTFMSVRHQAHVRHQSCARPWGRVWCLVRMVLVFARCTSLKPVYVLCANACRCVVCTGLHSCRMQMLNHVLTDYLLVGNDCTAFSILCHTPKKRRSYGAIQPFLVSTQFWRPAKCVLTNQNYVLIGHERYRMKYTRDLTFPYLLSEIRC